MNKFTALFKNRIVQAVLLIVILAGTAVAFYLSQNNQEVRQRAAGGADLVPESFQLVDSAGNTRTTFYAGEQIFVKVRIKNIGLVTGNSTDNFTYSEVYVNTTNTVSPNTPGLANVSIKTGEFSAGLAKTYASNYYGTNRSAFTDEYSWSRSSIGTFTARVFVNFDHKVTEDNYDNNQITTQYTITALPQTGTVRTTPPSNFSSWPDCIEPDDTLVPGLRGCVGEGMVSGKAVGKIRNIGSTTQLVGMAIYKIYEDYPNPYPACDPADCIDEFNWVWTQTYLNGKTVSLDPGETAYFELSTPNCGWQADVFKGSILPSFFPPTTSYSGQNNYLDGYLENTPQICDTTVVTPSPSPSSSPTASPTRTPTPVPSGTPTNTPSPTVTPSPTITSCPIPGKVLNVRIVCPNCTP